MTTITAAFARDANSVPITQPGLMVASAQVLVGNNTTVAVPIFAITGNIQVNCLYGVVTTALGVNNTAAYWRLNDGTTQANISLNTGTTISAAPAGSILLRRQTAASALTLNSATAGTVQDNPASISVALLPFVASQKTGGVTTNIEFVYSTTDAPTTGAITFYCGWIPLAPIASGTFASAVTPY